MRILFVTGLSPHNGGGSLQSTVELAVALQHRGHVVQVLCGSRRRPEQPRLYKRLVNAATKLTDSPAARAAWLAAGQPGRVARPRRNTEVALWVSAVPENALPAVVRRFSPDVVVAGSVSKVAWRRVRQTSRSAGIPAVLYLRESVALAHLADATSAPDLVLSNAGAHAVEAAGLGHVAVVVPSVVDTAATRTQSTRQTVLYVNPVESRGVHLAFALAEACPDLPFVFLESWPLGQKALAAVQARAEAVGNVEVRRRMADRSRIYADARVLLVPYRVPNRPRVVLEAQANAIPVLGSNLGGIAEAIGPGGLVVDPDAPVSAWRDALLRLWDDPGYEAYSRAAAQHASRAEVDVRSVAEQVEQALLGVATRTAQG